MIGLSPQISRSGQGGEYRNGVAREISFSRRCWRSTCAAAASLDGDAARPNSHYSCRSADAEAHTQARGDLQESATHRASERSEGPDPGDGAIDDPRIDEILSSPADLTLELRHSGLGHPRSHTPRRSQVFVHPLDDNSGRGTPAERLQRAEEWTAHWSETRFVVGIEFHGSVLLMGRWCLMNGIDAMAMHCETRSYSGRGMVSRNFANRFTSGSVMSRGIAGT
jgi:hypothetical protein